MWRRASHWPTIALLSLALLILTLNPLWVGFSPYVRAAWPALRTGVWLKKADPWKARGTVGLLFHFCLALLSAGASGLVSVLVTVIATAITQEQPNLFAFMVAILIILLGCLLSSVLGWMGVAIAFHHRVRIFAMPNLYTVCQGDFARARTWGPARLHANLANIVRGVATIVPCLAIWFVAMLATIPRNPADQPQPIAVVLLGVLPLLAIACLIITVVISNRIMASSPAECWGAEVPDADCP